MQILNEIAGRTAARMLHWVVPQLMEAIDDESVDVNRMLDRIVNGVMHHPAQREMGHDGVREARQLIFASVQGWWGDMGDEQREDYRRKLSPQGVFNGENHKEGVHDTGHGCGKLKMRKEFEPQGGIEDEIAGAAATAIFSGATGAISGFVSQNTGVDFGSSQHQSSGGDDGIGGLISGLAGNLLGGAFEQGSTNRETSRGYGEDGSYTQRQTEYGQQGDRYGQAQYTETHRPDGRRESEYQRYEQQDSSYGNRGYGSSSYEERRETQESSYERRTERYEYTQSTEESYGGGYSERRSDSRGSNRSHGHHHSSHSHSHSHHRSRDESESYERRDDDYESGYGRQQDSYERQEERYGDDYNESRHHRRNDDDEYNDDEYKVRDHGGNSGGYRF